MVSAARRRANLAPRTSAARACAASPIATAPVEPGYHYHSETNMDLMQPGAQRAGGQLRGARPAAALDRERMGPRTGRMHVRAARRADRRRQRAHLPHRDAADLPAHGLFRDLHDAARRSRDFYSSGWHLHQSLVECAHRAATSSCRSQPAHAFRPSGRNYLGGLLDHAVPSHRVRHADRQRLSALQAELAGARSRVVGLRSSRRDGARAGRRGRSGDAAWKTASASRRPIPISSSCSQIVCGPCRHRREERSRRAGRRALRGQAHAAARRACWTRSTLSKDRRCIATRSATSSSTIISS